MKRAGWLCLIMLFSSVCALALEDSQVDALLAIKDAFENSSLELLSWEIVTSPCSWQGVKCRKDKDEVTSLELSGRNLSGKLSPEVGKLSSLVHLNLSSNRLSGEIPSEIGNLTALRVLDLHGNELQGRIPRSLVNLKMLRRLDLSYNRLTGPVPRGLSAKTESLEGNPGLCTGESCSDPEAHSVSKVMLAVMMSVLGLLSIFAIAGSIRWYRHSKSFSELASAKFDQNGGAEYPTDYTIEELKLATAEFDEANIVGQGINGIVYRGRSSTGYDVAVKQLINVEFKVEFQKDLLLLSRARHKNVARLLGFCYSRNQKFLVSEYLPFPSLKSWLSGQRRKEFDWDKRKIVILGVAKGLAHLHSSNPEIAHGGLKPSNILIDEDFTPKLTDYGLHNLLEESTRTFDIRNAAYEPPETSTSQATLKSDTYGFGVFLVQMITGQPPWLLLERVKSVGLKLRDWVVTNINNEREEFLDEELLKKAPFWEVKKIGELAGMCMEMLPVARPRMEEVVQYLVEEVLISNKSSELDGLFIELVMDRPQNHSGAAAASGGESLLPSGSTSSYTK